jgi:hypothetical protein
MFSSTISTVCAELTVQTKNVLENYSSMCIELFLDGTFYVLISFSG